MLSVGTAPLRAAELSETGPPLAADLLFAAGVFGVALALGFAAAGVFLGRAGSVCRIGGALTGVSSIMRPPELPSSSSADSDAFGSSNSSWIFSSLCFLPLSSRNREDVVGTSNLLCMKCL